MTDRQMVENKLRNIQQYLRELEQTLAAGDTSAILHDFQAVHTVERLFQLIVDTMGDINAHLIAENDFGTPEDYQSTFLTLARHEILPVNFAYRIAPMVGLRNLIVHKYEDVDMKKFLRQLKTEIGDVEEFSRLIQRHLSSL